MYYPTGFKVYGQQNTISGDFSLGKRWLSERQFSFLSKYEIQQGDIILTRKGSVGHARRVPGDIQRGIADSDTIRVRVDISAIVPEYLVLCLRDSAYVQEQIKLVQRGAILAGLNTSTIANLLIVLPPLEEQSDVLNYSRLGTSKLSAAVDHIQNQLSIALEYRTRLIADVVTGKIDVRGLAFDLPYAFDDSDLPDLDGALDEDLGEEVQDEHE
jgi:type I restriction enzyme S subunit